MSRRLRVFVSGPISTGDLGANIEQARTAAQQLIRAGFAPLVPHLTCFMESNEPSVSAGFDHATWMEVDLPWVEVADAVLRLPGESKGAEIECRHAREHGVPVYHSMQELFTAHGWET